MKRNLFIATALATLSPVAGFSAEPDSSQPEFKVEVEAGVEYDSNVGVAELDRNTGASDSALLLGGNAVLEWAPIKRLTTKVGYDFSSKTYSEQSDFNLQIHRGFGEAVLDLDIVEAGVAYNHATALLDGATFLTLQDTTLHVSRLFAKQLYVRLSAHHQDKDFETDTRRNAEADGFGGDIFWFFNQARSFIAIGGKSLEEDAVGAEFDHDATNLKARFSHKFDFAGKEHQLKIGWQHEARDYDNITPSIGAVREDDRQTISAEIETGLTERLALVGKLQATESDSNLPSADYSEEIASLGVRFRF